MDWHCLAPPPQMPKRRASHRRTVFLGTSLWLMKTLLVLGLLAGCGAAPAAAPQELRIGLVTTLSGDLADAVGRPIVQAAQLAVQEVNEEGGLLVGGQRHKVVLLIEDDHDTPDTTIAAVQKLINQENIAVLVGPLLSRNAIPASNVAEKARIPMVSPKSTHPDTTAGKQYVFRVAFLDPFQGQVMANFARDELKAERVAVLYDVASAYNKGVAEIFKQEFEAAGGQVVAFESYTTGVRDFTPSLTRIQAAQPEVIFLPNYVNEVPRQARQARELGITVPLLGSDSWTANSYTPDQDGVFFSAHWTPDAINEESRAFIEAYQQAFDTVPDERAALTYDTLRLVFTAAQRQSSIIPEDIREGLATMGRYIGVTGTMDFQGTGDPRRSVMILQIRDGGAHFYKIINP